MAGYQIRHKELGIYQGDFCGMLFWHPLSQMPEQGWCEFATMGEAKRFIDIVTNPEILESVIRREDLVIEPFDIEQEASVHFAGLVRFEIEKAKGQQPSQP